MQEIMLVVKNIIPFIVILGIIGWMKKWFHKPLLDILPISVNFCVLFLFPFGFFYNGLSVGIIILVLFACSFYAYTFVSLFRSRYKENNNICPSKVLKKIFANEELLFLCILYVVLMIANCYRHLTVWDEFIWATKLKKMLCINAFYSLPGPFEGFHLDYPPAGQLVQYMWVKLVGGYRETSLYVSLQFMMFSFVLPAVCKVKKLSGVKYYVQLFLELLVALGVPFLLPLGFGNTIYQDASIAIAFAGTLLVIWFELSKEFSYFYYAQYFMIMCMLLLLKEMGAAFYVFSWGILFISVVARWIKNHRVEVLDIKAIAIGTICSWIPSIIWRVHVKVMDLYAQFDAMDLNLFSFIGILKGTVGEEWQQQVITNFAIKLKWGLTFKPFECTYTVGIIIGVAIIFIFGFFVCKKYIETIILSLTLTIGALAYAIIMLMLYLFSFGEYEGVNIASYHRYMGTYVYVVWISAVFIVLYSIMNSRVLYKLGNLKLVIMAILMYALFVSEDDKATIYAGICYQNDYAMYEKCTELVEKHTSENSSIYSVTQASNGAENTRLSYLVLPRTLFGGSLGEKYNDGDVWTQNYSIDELKGILRQEADYVLLFHVDDQFRNIYSSLFTECDRETLDDNQLYLIDKSGDEIELRRVDTLQNDNR